jgi:hypothetical protein
MTGYGMSQHGQALEFSTKVHQFFGASLVLAGLCRIIEICFVLHDAPTPAVEVDVTGEGRRERGPKAFQHLTPFLLTLSGVTFLSSTEEMMQWVAGSVMDSVRFFSLSSFLLTKC